ncbi:MAG: rod shape-determining protein MreD [Bacteroidetes bacterium RIFCSPLOWO2_12_FULL_35_15]|nr:MAG: rod shape-determining protein MreD [Bacteroidetes bacterium RIFCSPLOWO2_12_FULL_35_15]
MANVIIRNIIRFFLLVLVQVLIIKNIELGRFINPFVYVLFIVVLPFETPKWLLLCIAFILGITIDMFYDTAGMHAAACVFMAYLRPGVLKLFSPRDGYEFGTQPTIQYLGVPWFLSYAGILVVLHHLILFYIEVFRFSEFFSTFFRVLVSSIFTMLLIVISQYFFQRKKEQE